MKTVTLCFQTIFELRDFLRYVTITNVDVQLNFLTGNFSKEIIELAITKFHATIVERGKKAEFLN